jgi:hypothetical protein
MQDTNISKSHTLSHKVKVDFNVLGALMLNWAGGHVDGANIVTVDNGGVA